MSSLEQNNITTEQRNEQEQLKQYSSVAEQLSFPDSSPILFTPVPYFPIQDPVSTSALLTEGSPAPGVTRQLANVDESSARATRQLPTPFTTTGALSNTQTAALPPIKRTTTSLRQPIVIRGSGKKSCGTLRPPKGRRMVINIAAVSLLTLIVLATLSTVLPVDSSAKAGFKVFQPIFHFVKSSNNSISLVAQQATVTAVTQDGFDPGNGQIYAGLPTAPVTNSPDSPGSTLSSFLYGQCTYWADLRYHQLTGHWVNWLGNAYQWVYGAQSSGWNVSSVPRVPSIIVLMPGVQGAGPFGHVAVVESINSNGTVVTSDFNWGGSWATVTDVTFSPGGGVYFVSYPG